MWIQTVYSPFLVASFLMFFVTSHVIVTGKPEVMTSHDDIPRLLQLMWVHESNRLKPLDFQLASFLLMFEIHMTQQNAGLFTSQITACTNTWEWTQ